MRPTALALGTVLACVRPASPDLSIVYSSQMNQKQLDVALLAFARSIDIVAEILTDVSTIDTLAATEPSRARDVRP